MNCKSPLVKYIFDPINFYLDSKIKNNININNIALLQISYLLFILSFYYYSQNLIERSGLLYLGSIILFYKYSKNLEDNDIKLISELSYFIINCLLILIINDKNYNEKYLVIFGILIFITIISFIIKLDTNINYKNEKLIKLNNQIKFISNYIYPYDNKTKLYHINNFWNLFDLITLLFIIFLFISLNS